MEYINVDGYYATHSYAMKKGGVVSCLYKGTIGEIVLEHTGGNQLHMTMKDIEIVGIYLNSKTIEDAVEEITIMNK